MDGRVEDYRDISSLFLECFRVGIYHTTSRVFREVI